MNGCSTPNRKGKLLTGNESIVGGRPEEVECLGAVAAEVRCGTPGHYALPYRDTDTSTSVTRDATDNLDATLRHPFEVCTY